MTHEQNEQKRLSNLNYEKKKQKQPRACYNLANHTRAGIYQINQEMYHFLFLYIFEKMPLFTSHFKMYFYAAKI